MVKAARAVDHQPSPAVVGPPEGAGLHVVESDQRGRAAQQGDIGSIQPMSTPMLMDVPEYHGLQ